MERVPRVVNYDHDKFVGVAAIAPWFCLRLPSCGPGFKSQAHHLHFFQFVLLKLYQENNENKQKKAGIGPLKKVGKIGKRIKKVVPNLFCRRIRA